MCASTILSPGILTLNIAFGNASTMLPSTSIFSSLLPMNLRQNLRSILRNCDRVFKMSRALSVACDGGPSILQNPDFGTSQIHHRLDCQHHPSDEPRPCSGLAKVWNRGRFVQGPADPMPHEGAHHRITLRF